MTDAPQKTRQRPYGEGELFKRAHIWHIAYSVGGRRYRESARSAVRKDAERLLKKRLAEKTTGQFLGPQMERVSFSDLSDLLYRHYDLNRRKSRPRAEIAMGHLAGTFGSDTAMHITPDRLEDYAVARQRDGAAPASVRYELAILRKAFRCAVRARVLRDVPAFPVLDVDNARQGFFEPADLEALCQHLTPALRAVVRFAYLTGWRIPSEVLPLTWDRVDLDAGVVRLDVGTTKNSDGRTFPIDALPELLELLRAQRRDAARIQLKTGQPVPWVFHRAGRRILDFRDDWRKALKAAKLPADRIPHDFRRSAVRNLERAGVPRSVAMKLTGHKTEEVYRRYAIVSERDLREGVRKLAGTLGGVKVS